MARLVLSKCPFGHISEQDTLFIVLCHLMGLALAGRFHLNGEEIALDQKDVSVIPVAFGAASVHITSSLRASCKFPVSLRIKVGL